MQAESNGWTGGQYSLFRFAVGLYLFGHFVSLLAGCPAIPGATPSASSSAHHSLLQYFPSLLSLWPAPSLLTGVLIAGALLSVVFAVGWHDRGAAVLLWYFWMCLFCRNSSANAAWPYASWLLLGHLGVPAEPYGALAARDRVDPAGGWRLPLPLFVFGWMALAFAYGHSGYTKLLDPDWQDGTMIVRLLDDPAGWTGFLREAFLCLPEPLLRSGMWLVVGLQLLFAPLALIRFVRPWLWTTTLLMQVALMVLIGSPDMRVGLLLLHFFTLDPAWVKPLRGQTERLFYDGHCGLCHSAVRFLLAEDRSGNAFRFAPLGSEAFRSAIPEAERAGLGDTLVVQTSHGGVLLRSRAVLHIMQRLGGIWRLLAGLLKIIPIALLDCLYDVVAWSRHRLFRRPTEACPILPAHLRRRFDV